VLGFVVAQGVGLVLAVAAINRTLIAANLSA
jgi:hypothetical protein